MRLKHWAVLATALCFLAACSPQVSKEQANPAPSSSYTKEAVISDAALWAVVKPGRAYTNILPTGSMVPYADSNSIVLYEVYKDQKLNVGDWIHYDRGDIHDVLHRIDDVRPGYVHVAGMNNQMPDGWFPTSTIKFRVAGILYSSR